MLNAVGLGILFQAKDEATEVAHTLHEALHGVHEQAEKTHEGVLAAFGGATKIIGGAALAIGAIGVGAGFEFAEHAERFSGALNKAGIAAHATAAEMEDLEKSVKSKALDSMSGNAITAAQTLQQLALEGFNVEESLQALDGSLQLMDISMGALDSRGAAGLVNDTLGQFGMSADESSELADKLAFSMQHFGFRAEELSGVMSGLASGAHLTGSSLDDVLIGVGLIKQVFPSATKSAGAMNVAMMQLTDTHRQQLIASTLGINVVDQHTKKLRPLIDVMRDLSVKTARMSDAQLTHTLETIAGGRAAGGLSAIIDGLRKGVTDSSGKLLTGAAALDYYRDQLNKSGGAAADMSNALNNDLGGSINTLKNAVSNAGTLFGSMFEGGFTSAVKAANLAIRGLTQLFAQGGFSGEVLTEMDKAGNGGIKNFAIQTFMWIKRIQNFFSNLIDSFQETFKKFEPVIETLGLAFSMLGNILGLTAQTADQNADKFDSFGTAGQNVGSVLAQVAGILSGVLLDGIILIIGWVETMKAEWEILGPSILAALQVVKGAFGVIGALITGDWEALWIGMADIVFGAMKVVVKTVYAAVDLIAKALDVVTFGKFNYSATVQAESKRAIESLTGAEAATKNPGAVSVSPALAQMQSNQAAFKRSDRGLIDESPGFLSSTQSIHTHVHIDGKQVAEAVHKVKRDDSSRSFHSGDDKGGKE